MMNTSPQPLSIQGRQRQYHGFWKLNGEILEWDIEGKTLLIDSVGDLSAQVIAYERVLGSSFLRDQVKVKGSLNCEHFQMSSMARDMGRGQRGVCGLHLLGVEICFLCNEFQWQGGFG